MQVGLDTSRPGQRDAGAINVLECSYGMFMMYYNILSMHHNVLPSIAFLHQFTPGGILMIRNPTNQTPRTLQIMVHG